MPSPRSPFPFFPFPCDNAAACDIDAPPHVQSILQEEYKIQKRKEKIKKDFPPSKGAGVAP